MSSSPNVLQALDKCLEELEMMSEAELIALAQEFHDFVTQRAPVHGQHSCEHGD